MRTISRFALALSFAAVAVYAQVKETVTVSVVEVPVTVVDRAGEPVRGLTAANFKILDDGKERPVTAFDTIDFASVESLKATSPMNPAARRNFMLLFDTGYSGPKSIERAQTAARDFIAKMVQKRDRVAVATINPDLGFHLVTAFTTDRALLTAAIANPSAFRGNDPLQISSVGIPESATLTMSGIEGRGNDAQSKTEMNEVAQRSNHAEDQLSRVRVEKEINMLAGLSRSLRSIAGQKNLVFLSEGFDPQLVQGRGAGLTADQFNSNNAIEHGEVWKVDTDDIYGSAKSLNIVDKMADMARRSDVVLYAVDIKGVRSNVDAAGGYSLKSNEGLHLLANATGGTVFENTNNLAGDFQKVIKHQEVSYVLAFTAPTSQPGKFHKLQVKLVNVPNGAHLSSRTGYYEAGGENAVERSLSNAEIVLNDIPQGAIHVAELAAVFSTNTPNAQVPVILEINGSDLINAAKNNVATTEVFVYAFDDEGLVRDSLFQRLSLDTTKVSDKLKSSGVKYYATLSLPEGHYAIKSLVRVAETESKGFTRNDIIVPRAGEIALSQPLFPEEAGKWVMIKGGSHDKTNAGYPFEVNGEPFVPSAAADVKGGQRKFIVFVQGAAPDEMTVDTNPKAKVVSQLKSPTGSKLVFELDGPTATASTLNVTVKKKGSNAEQTSSVPLIAR
jgi:VWFA-related protein